MGVFYTLYFLLTSNYKIVKDGINCLKSKSSKFNLLFDAILSSYKYGTSLDDYFSFGFYDKSLEERSEFATTLFMYKFHKRLNHNRDSKLIDNKLNFSKYFKEFSNKSYIFSIDKYNCSLEFDNWLAAENVSNFVLKKPESTIGDGIGFVKFEIDSEMFFVEDSKVKLSELIREFKSGDELYVEKHVEQHSVLQELFPTALNTIRIITVINSKDEVDIISASLRISIQGKTDNFSAGNLAAAIDIQTGVVISEGVKRLSVCSKRYKEHPITGTAILGLKLPFWVESLDLVKRASFVFPKVRTVGWDVAITENGPLLIEGNPKWNKGAPQIPLNKGIKPILKNYL